MPKQQSTNILGQVTNQLAGEREITQLRSNTLGRLQRVDTNAKLYFNMRQLGMICVAAKGNMAHVDVRGIYPVGINCFCHCAAELMLLPFDERAQCFARN